MVRKFGWQGRWVAFPANCDIDAGARLPNFREGCDVNRRNCRPAPLEGSPKRTGEGAENV